MSRIDRGPGDESASVPLAIQVVSGIGGIFLVVGAVLLGLSYLDRGMWGTPGDPPARMALLGVVILLGAALSHAVTDSEDPGGPDGEE